MITIGLVALAAIGGYLIGAFGGGYLVFQLSSNRHDRELEAAMTGAFAIGPVVSLLAGIGMLIFRLSK
ncbi:MAG: hypothetical protein HY774_20560 [Acidobacteria bacterium]|nr:hypothetical protein [Acidobacteriota bacterium]